MIKGNLRKVTIDDAKTILDWRNQDFVRNNMYNNNIIDYETHINWFQKMLINKTVQYFIYEKNNIPIGVVSFYNIDLKSKKAFWAFYLGDEKSRGAGVEMEKLALDYAFNTLGLYKLSCEVLSFNQSVIEFHKKFGFYVEGIKVNEYFRDGNYYDIYQLALFREIYESLKIPSNQKLPKSNNIELNIENIYAENLLQDIFSILKKDIRKEFILENSHIKILNGNVITGIVVLKIKLVYQSLNSIKFETIVTHHDSTILAVESTFKRNSHENT